MDLKSTIKLRNLDVYYGNNHALKNINIEFPERQITAIIGASGCGKTTLLKCMNRLLESDEEVRITGNVLIDDVDIYGADVEVSELRKKMGLLSQKPFPLPMSIFDNVAFGPKIHNKLKKKEVESLVEHYLKEVSLWDEVKDRLHSPASKLSIGQQQRLCLARGLAVEPEIILGDESTSALDPNSSLNIENKFIELKEKYTIILVTHILRQARRIADYIVFMHLGEIIEHGPAAVVLNNPKQEKTIEFIQGIIH